MAIDETSKPSSISPYPQMILSAIEDLEEEGGSNKSSISHYIEAKYGEQLPEAHASLLSAHLQRMKEVGELVMVKNNYMKSDPNAPLKRGRGRPPKPKPELPVGEAAATPRPRGRPPKPKDPLAAAVAKIARGFGSRPRGRPPKRRAPDGDSGNSEAVLPRPAAAPAPAPTGGVKRGRGRPPKVKPQFTDVGFA